MTLLHNSSSPAPRSSPFASHSSLKLAAVVAAALLPAAASLALADSVDTSRPRLIVVGKPRGYAPNDRLDAQRSGRTTTRLPPQSHEAWRRHISGGIEAPPVINAQGHVLVSLTVPEVVNLDATGKEVWRVRIGSNAALAPGVLTSNDTLVLVSSAGIAWGITSAGTVRFASPLGIRGRDADVTSLALEDGAVVIAAGRALLELTADGHVRARAELPDRAVGGLLAGPAGTLITTDSGDVLTWRSPTQPRKLGSFGGSPRRGAVLIDARTLLAVVDGRRVVALDMPTGTTQVRSSGSLIIGSFDAPPAVTKAGLAITTSTTGLLYAFDPAGNEKLHFIVDKPPPASMTDAGAGIAGFFGTVESKPSPPVLVDRDGRIAFVRFNGRVGVINTDSSITITNERICGVPVALLPAGENRMLIACRDGTLVMLEE